MRALLPAWDQLRFVTKHAQEVALAWQKTEALEEMYLSRSLKQLGASVTVQMTAEASNSIYSSFRVGVYGKKHRMKFLQQAVRQIPRADSLVDVVSVPVRARG